MISLTNEENKSGPNTMWTLRGDEVLVMMVRVTDTRIWDDDEGNSCIWKKDFVHVSGVFLRVYRFTDFQTFAKTRLKL
jgi:hypothetical protein